jgi:hypothetical protein
MFLNIFLIKNFKKVTQKSLEHRKLSGTLNDFSFFEFLVLEDAYDVCLGVVTNKLVEICNMNYLLFF